MPKAAAKEVEVRYGMPRGAEGIKCSCGGYAESVATTHDENMKYDCGRYQMSVRALGEKGAWHCCAVAFECAVCGKRIVGTQAAPEMD